MTTTKRKSFRGTDDVEEDRSAYFPSVPHLSAIAHAETVHFRGHCNGGRSSPAPSFKDVNLCFDTLVWLKHVYALCYADANSTPLGLCKAILQLVFSFQFPSD